MSLTNTGTINGIIDMGSFHGGDPFPDDTIVNLGTINGDIFLGTANDSYFGGSGIQNGDIYGGWGDDTIVGTAAGDFLLGDDGDDTITGNGGNDVADGGDGYDTFVLAGKKADYVIADLGGGVHSIENIASGEIDTIAGFEVLKFAKGRINFTHAREGTPHAETLHGTSHADLIFGFDGDDTIFGGNKNDTLYGGKGADTIYGGNGDDFIDGGWGMGAFYGGSGEDTVSFATSTIRIEYDLRHPLDFLLTDSVEDLVGTAFDDKLTGTTGVNRLYGGMGDDTLVGAGGHDVLDGGDGIDFASFETATSALTISLGSGPAHTGGVTLVNIEGVVGSAFDDVITGTRFSDFIGGGAGNDILDGGRGFDFVDFSHEAGGASVDLRMQGVAQQTGAGTDTLNGFEGVIGTNYTDHLVGDDHDNVFVGNFGSDIIDGGGGIDTVVFNFTFSNYLAKRAGGPGDGLNESIVHVNGSGNGDTIFNVEYLQFTDQTVAVSDLTPAYTIHGTDADETLEGDLNSDQIYGGGGDDIIIGHGGGDDVFGDAGDDTIYIGVFAGTFAYGGDGVDTIVFAGDRDSYDISVTSVVDVSGPGGGHVYDAEFLQFADQTIAVPTTPLESGGAPIGDDVGSTMVFTAFDDISHGWGGDDNISGNGGNDILDGGDGNDTLDGGTGIDTASYATAGAAVQVSLAISGPQDTVGEGTDTLTGFENLTGSAFDDVLTGDAGDNVLEGGAGNDQLDGGAGIDTASYVKAAAGVIVDLNLGLQDTVGAGTDTLGGFENLLGSQWNDELTGNASDNALSGGRGDDALTGGFGDDALYGGDASDRLTGGRGADVLDGGLGDDTFAFAGALDSRGAAYDTIQDFDALTDGMEVPVAIGGVDAWVTAGTLTVAHFVGDMNAAIGTAELGTHHAVLFTANSGDLAGTTFLLVDLDGHAGWSPTNDLVVRLDAGSNLADLSALNFT